jgi:CRISPR/Cas system CSM-associated protein Csm3 (group 7 of RAMP superfamily)
MINLQELLSNSLEPLELVAVIDTALCVGAGGSSGSLADKSIIRNAKGKLLIPASQLKGRLRHECEKLARGLGWSVCESPNPQTMCPQRAGLVEDEARRFQHQYQGDGEEHYHCLICQVFGNPVAPSRIIFDDLICLEEPENLPPEVLRPGVTLNRRRRTAEDQKLYFLETSPANAQLQFVGAIHLQLDCPSYAKALIAAGLRHIHALGGSKSVGLGWLHWEFPSDFQVGDAAWQKLSEAMR